MHRMKFDRESCSKELENYTIYKTLCNAINGYPERTSLNTNVLLENKGKQSFTNTFENKICNDGDLDIIGNTAHTELKDL